MAVMCVHQQSRVDHDSFPETALVEHFRHNFTLVIPPRQSFSVALGNSLADRTTLWIKDNDLYNRHLLIELFNHILLPLGKRLKSIKTNDCQFRLTTYENGFSMLSLNHQLIVTTQCIQTG